MIDEEHACTQLTKINEILLDMRAIRVVLLGDFDTKKEGMLEEHRKVIKFVNKMEESNICELVLKHSEYIEEQKNSKKWFGREVISATIGAIVAAACLFISKHKGQL
jgi:hypothetical protein